MKTCEVCGRECDPEADHCPACGEASWLALPAVPARGTDDGDASAATPAKPGKRGGR